LVFLNNLARFENAAKSEKPTFQKR